jgi:hypothetical protein
MRAFMLIACPALAILAAANGTWALLRGRVLVAITNCLLAGINVALFIAELTVLRGAP